MATGMSTPSRISRYYQITVEGKIDPSWSEWLGGIQVFSWQKSDGRQMTTLSGFLVDQVALRGLLIRLWDLNMVLYSVQQCDPVSMSTIE